MILLRLFALLTAVALSVSNTNSATCEVELLPAVYLPDETYFKETGCPVAARVLSRTERTLVVQRLPRVTSTTAKDGTEIVVHHPVPVVPPMLYVHPVMWNDGLEDSAAECMSAYASDIKAGDVIRYYPVIDPNGNHWLTHVSIDVRPNGPIPPIRRTSEQMAAVSTELINARLTRIHNAKLKQEADKK